jgi:GNAT superfamily N-acetyltransferase
MKFTYRKDLGHEVCSLILIHLWADVFAIIQEHVEAQEAPPTAWVNLIHQALVEARTQHAGSVLFRLIERDGSVELSRELPALGFIKKHDRIEFRAALTSLPIETDSPLQWMSASELNWDAQKVAEFLLAVSEGDPDSEPSQDPVKYIDDWLKDPVLTSGLDCISVGFINDRPAALVVAQINPKTQWSRITYMGLAPEFRKKGFGKAIHRHGFSMMRAQGGEIYHGGTTSTNKPMLRLFTENQCPVYQRMQEWACHLNKEVGR